MGKKKGIICQATGYELMIAYTQCTYCQKFIS